MPSNIILKKSSVVAKVPLTTDLEYGELALNYADGKLYYKKSDGTTIDAFQSNLTGNITTSNISSYALPLSGGNLTGSLGVTGSIVATANITAYGTVSDITLKENILPLKDCLKILRKLNVYSFNYIGDDNELIGLLAQELEKHLPQLVYEFTPLGSTVKKKAIRYELLTALLIGAVKDQDDYVRDLETRITRLEKLVLGE